MAGLDPFKLAAQISVAVGRRPHLTPVERALLSVTVGMMIDRLKAGEAEEAEEAEQRERDTVRRYVQGR